MNAAPTRAAYRDPGHDQHFIPRPYQRDVLRAMARGACRRAFLLWRRRAGKDKVCYTFMGDRAMRARVGNYLYIFPTLKSARRNLWDNLDGDGFRTIRHVPKAKVVGENQTEMKLTLDNGSTIQVVGAEDVRVIEDLRGPNPVGIVFSEWARMNPLAWTVLHPVLTQNGGWAIFNTTPNGPNHAKKMWDMASRNPAWFAQRVTVAESATPGLLAEIEAERVELAEQGWPAAEIEEYVRREYYCSFAAPVRGTIYGHLIMEAERAGRIGRVPYNPALPVHTAWDIGVRDATAIWFLQRSGAALHAVDYYEASGAAVGHYIKVLQERGYVYGVHVGPHDLMNKEWGGGGEAGNAVKRIEVAAGLGVVFEIAPDMGLADGIDATRRLIPRMWFDERRCAAGLDALRSYHYEEDAARRVFRKSPEHDWASHGADALRMWAVTDPRERGKARPPAIPGAARSGGAGEHGWMGV